MIAALQERLAGRRRPAPIASERPASRSKSYPVPVSAAQTAWRDGNARSGIETRTGFRPTGQSRAEGCAVPSRVSDARLDRDRIVSAAAPRMAAQQAPSGQQRSVPRSVTFGRFGSIPRAARVVAARRREGRGDQHLVCADRSPQRQTQQPGRPALTHQFDSPRRTPARHSRHSSRPADKSGETGPAAPAGLPVDLPQRGRQVSEQVHIAPLSGASSGDQDIIGPGPPVAR